MTGVTGALKWEMTRFKGKPLPSVATVFAGRPRGVCTGLMTRTSSSKEFFAPNIGSLVHEIKWNEWQPTSSGGLVAAEVAEALSVLDWAQANGKRVRLRIFAGLYAPAWVRAAGGGMNWYEYSASAGETLRGPIPVWWSSGYRTAYNGFRDLLIAALAAHPACYEVTNSTCMTVFAEPMNRQWGSTSNVQAAHANGYTTALDIAAMKQAFVDHQPWVNAGVAVYSAFNPWQDPRNLDADQSGGAVAVPAVTYDLLDAFQASLGRGGVIANNSIGAPVTSRGPRYADLWNYMAAQALRTYPFHQAIGFQTMNARVMEQFATTAYATGSMCADLGACAVEMPEGWLTDPEIGMTSAQAAELNARLLANTTAAEG